MLNKLLHILESSILCIRFPFLYPRNVWTDAHYTNYRIDGISKSAYLKAFSFENKKQGNYNKTVKKLKSIRYAVLYYFTRFHQFVIRLMPWHFIPIYTLLDYMETGWRKAFGIDLCKDLKKALMESGGRTALRKFKIIDIKEKYGTLRIYANGTNKRVNDVLTKYEELSWRTCIDCGKPSTRMTTGWICPYCDDCAKNHNNTKPISL